MRKRKGQWDSGEWCPAPWPEGEGAVALTRLHHLLGLQLLPKGADAPALPACPVEQAPVPSGSPRPSFGDESEERRQGGADAPLEWGLSITWVCVILAFLLCVESAGGRRIWTVAAWRMRMLCSWYA